MKKLLLLLAVVICNNSFSQNNATTLYFEQGAEWKYLDDGSDQGTEWRNQDFDDSQWKNGSGHFGFGDGDEDTVLKKGFITYYFRKKVFIEDINQIQNVFFNIIHDDGAVVYVNGTEVLRSKLMPQGEITYLTGTTTFIPNDLENEFFEYKVSKDYFTNGENTIAIEIHNQKKSSSDVSFDCKINDQTSFFYENDGPYVFYRNNKIEIKSIIDNTLETTYYDKPEDVTLQINLPNNLGNFSVSLHDEMIIQPDIYKIPQKYLAVSDIEGEIEAFVMLLKDSGVMDENFEWSFGEGHLIIAGDMFDRGKYVTECLWLLYKLEREAISSGGKVHYILGNHDVMNVIGDFRYVHPKYIENEEVLNESLMSRYAADSEFGKWIRTRNIIEKIGSFVFLHAGISPQVQALNLNYMEMNNWGRHYMDNGCPNNDCNTINKTNGLYWYRGMAKETLTQEQVDSILEQFEAEKVVVGHTIFNNITLLYSEKVIGIDLAHARNFREGFMNALYYENEQMYDFRTNGTEKSYTPLGEKMSLSVIEESFDSKIKVFPNPFHNKFQIRWGNIEFNSSQPTTVKLYDVLGKLIYNEIITASTLETNIYINDIPNGMYFLHIDINGKTLQKKLIKN